MPNSRFVRATRGKEFGHPEILPTLKLSSEELERYAGRVVIPGQGSFDVALRDGELFLELSGQPPYRMYASAADDFYLRVAVASMTYTCAAEVCDTLSHDQPGAASVTAERQPEGSG